MVEQRSVKQPKSIRIFYIIDHLRYGGTQIALTRLLRGLMAQKIYEIHVYCLNDVSADTLKVLHACDVRVIIIGRRQMMTGIGLLLLGAELRRWKPAIVQTQLPVSNLVGCVLAHIVGVPATIYAVRTSIQETRYSLQSLFHQWTMRWVDVVTVNSRNAVSHQGSHHPRMVYIPNGVEPISAQDVQMSSADLRAAHGLAPNTRIIGMVGQLFVEKGYPHLLTALTHVIPVVPDVVLLIIGDGPLRTELTDYAQQLHLNEHVRFLGVRKDVPAFLSALDLYVHSSVIEGMSNAIMEAMMAARPIVATNVGATSDLIIDGETGWLVEPANAKALARQIIYALEHPEEARQMGEAAAERATRHFSVAAMVNAYDALYRELVARKQEMVRKR